MTTVAITGVGQLLGRRVLAALDADAAVERIVGLDARPPEGGTSPKLRFHTVELHDPELGGALDEVDVLLHLAFPTDAAQLAASTGAGALAGTRKLFEAAREAGVRRIVHLSSATVYGAHPDNEVPLTEDSPLRGDPEPVGADHPQEVETWLGSWAGTVPQLQLAVLRPAVVLGPGVENGVTRLLESPRIATVRGHRPPLQFVHLDDLVQAVVHVVQRGLTGAYNVASEGWLSFDEVTAIVDRPTVEVPEEIAYGFVEALWRLGLTAQPPAVLRYLMYPCVVSPARLLATGWRPRYVNRDALAASVAEHAPYVALGGLRLRRARVRGVALAAFAAAAALVGRGVRRRHAARSRRAPQASR